MSTEPISKERLDELVDDSTKHAKVYPESPLARDYAILVSDYARLREENEWQSIETAPKDGTSILTFPNYVVTHWEDEPDVIDLPGWVDRYDEGTDLYCALRTPRTHWMPLPQGPRHE